MGAGSCPGACARVCVSVAGDVGLTVRGRTLEEKYQLNLPEYPGFAQIVELPQADETQKL